VRELASEEDEEKDYLADVAIIIIIMFNTTKQDI